MPSIQNPACRLLAATCAMAWLAACTKPVDDTRNNVVPAGQASEATAGAAPAATESTGLAAASRFVARGNEPFWAVEVDGATLTWKTPEMPDGRKLVAERSAHGNGVSFAGTDGDRNFSLDINRAQCTDSMSGQEFEYTAAWNHGSERMTGCAERRD